MTAAALAILLVVISTLIFCSALFSGVETALFSLKPHQLRRLEANHARLTKFIQLFRENPRRVLNVLLLGDGLVNVLLVVLCLFCLWEGPLAGPSHRKKRHNTTKRTFTSPSPRSRTFRTRRGFSRKSCMNFVSLA